MEKLTTVELFAGIGGFRLAAEENGIKTIWANDINKLAAKVYESNFDDGTFILGDINELIDTIPDHDILTAGFPCQPFSKAGKKQGIDDFRGTLFESIVSVLSKRTPRYFILENVNSLLYLARGQNFRTILNALASLQYKIEWNVFNAASFGLPQHRERLIIFGVRDARPNETFFLTVKNEQALEPAVIERIADYTSWKRIAEADKKFGSWGMAYNGTYITADIPEETYFPAKKLKDVLQKSVDKSFDFTADTEKRIENSQYVNKYYNGVQILYNQGGGARMGYSIFGTEGTAPTLTASTSRHYERYAINNTFRRLTNIEYAVYRLS